MKALNSDMRYLLDKLYNLRGKDSIVFSTIEKEREEAVLTQDRTNLAKTDLEIKIEKLTEEERVLDVQGKKLISALASIEREEFADVLDKLNINFDPAKIEQQLENTLPEKMEEIANEKNEAEDNLLQVENEMNDAIAKLEELSIQKEEAIANQERLNNYFDLALSSNSNITRDEITSLLAKFDFSDDEQREAAKLLMFPEDGLFDYEENLTGHPVTRKNIGEVIHYAKNEASEPKKEPMMVNIEKFTTNEVKEPEIVEIKEAPVKIEPVKEVKAEEFIKPESPYVEAAPLLENITPEVNTEEKLEDSTPTKDLVIKTLTELGFDYLDFTSNDFNKMLENYNAELFKRNADVVQKLGVQKDFFNDNVELLYDKDLEAKIDMLVNIGKLPQDIYLNPTVLIKYSLGELDSAIKVLHESGLDPKNVPLMAY